VKDSSGSVVIHLAQLRTKVLNRLFSDATLPKKIDAQGCVVPPTDRRHGMEMATNRLRKVLGDLRSSVDTLSDGQLLARFAVGRDEVAFARLVRRHGPMVLGVCRRVLQHRQDAEDAFQATFLILARKAGSVLNREAVGSWLYRVAYRTAGEARAMRARRRAKERQVDQVPQPVVQAAEVHDWRPILDHELSRLPQKYQAAIVLCDLEAKSRKEAAQQLGIAEGTLSSRLASGRGLLAARLARRGVTLGAGGLVATLSAGVLSAHVPGSLVSDTAKAAALVAAGQLAAVSTPVAVLMKGALKTMLMARLKLVVGLFVGAVLTLGAGGVAYQTVSAQNAPAGQNPGKPVNEMEALRRENELLRLNLLVVLEKVRAQETELRALKEKPAASALQLYQQTLGSVAFSPDGTLALRVWNPGTPKAALSIEDAIKQYRAAKDGESRRQAIEAVEAAVQRLRQELGLEKRDGSDEKSK
jgi:RNA polymerase sigma factor (sigma-70 family)